jgi:pimeloyl-ACP methyl ester carboxylesterase
MDPQTPRATETNSESIRSVTHTAVDEFQFLEGDAARVGALPPEVERVTAEVSDGKSISALKYGFHAPRYVCLHGAGLNAHSFDPMIIALGRPALSVDLPGHGHSSWHEDANYTPERLWGEVAGFLEQFVDQPTPLIGHSLGGLIALHLAEQRPDLVSQVILVDVTPETSESANAATVAEFISGQRSFHSIDEMIDRAIDFGIGTDRDVLRRGITLNSHTREDGMIEWIHHLAHLPSFTSQEKQTAAMWPKNITVPLTLIRASNGLVTDTEEHSWQEHFPASRVEHIDGPHNLHEAVPVELARAVQSILPDYYSSDTER